MLDPKRPIREADIASAFMSTRPSQTTSVLRALPGFGTTLDAIKRGAELTAQRSRSDSEPPNLSVTRKAPAPTENNETAPERFKPAIGRMP